MSVLVLVALFAAITSLTVVALAKAARPAYAEARVLTRVGEAHGRRVRSGH